MVDDFKDIKGSRLRDEFKDFYGLLLSVNQRLDAIGTWLIWLIGISAVALCVAFHMRWFEGFVGFDIEKVRGAGVYVLVGIVAIAVFVAYAEIVESAIYRRYRFEIRQAMRQYKLDKYVVIAEIENDPELKEVRTRMKQDSEL